MNLKNLKFVFAVVMLFFVLQKPIQAANVTFNDLPPTHWAYNAVQTLSEEGIIQGYPDGSFRPDRKVTREQFAVILVKTLNIPLKDSNRAVQTFWDVGENHRSFLYIDAVKSFIPVPDPKGYAFNFYPDRPITREEAAQTIVRALNLHKAAQKPADNYLASKFRDYQSISPVYREYVAIAVYYSILSGNSEGNFSPRAALSRGEICAVMNIMLRNGAMIDEGFKPPRRPWTIEFIDFDRPDIEKVRSLPDYNEIQSFRGKITEKVLGVNNSHFVVRYPYEDDSTARVTIKYLITNVFVADKDLALFNIGDWVTFNYDRSNNVVSYSLNGKVYGVSQVK